MPITLRDAGNPKKLSTAQRALNKGVRWAVRPVDGGYEVYDQATGDVAATADSESESGHMLSNLKTFGHVQILPAKV